MSASYEKWPPASVVIGRLQKMRERVHWASGISEVAATSLMHEPTDTDNVHHALRSLTVLLSQVVEDVNSIDDAALSADEKRMLEPQP